MRMILARRSFIAGLATLIAAPAIVHAGNLMPVRALAPSPISMRLLTDYVAGPDVLIGSLDILYGWVVVKPEWAGTEFACPSS